MISAAIRTRTYVNQPAQLEIRDDDISNTVSSVTKDYMVMNMHTSARNPNRKNAHRGGSGPLISKDKSFAIETGQPHYVIETDSTK